MDATNFIFDGKSLYDFGYIICEFDKETNIVTPAKITYTTVKIPGTDRRRFVCSSYDNVLVFEFSIVKFNCQDKIEDIDQFEDSFIRRWLVREDGYKDLVFEQEDFDGIHFSAYINIVPHMIAGKIRGYDLTVTTDNQYGYSDWIENRFELTPSSPYSFYASSDRAGYFYPVWEITPVQSGNLSIKILEDTNQTNTVFSSVKKGETIIIDSENCIIKGTDPDNFNWVFPRIVQDYDYNFNTITTTLPCNIKVKYRLIRKVVF